MTNTNKNAMVHIIPDTIYNAAMQELAAGTVNKQATEKACNFYGIAINQADLIPHLRGIHSAVTAVTKGAVKKAVGYAVFSVLGFREEKGKLANCASVSPEHVAPIFKAIETAPFSAQIRAGAKRFAQSAGFTYSVETIDGVKYCKIVAGNAPDKAAIDQLVKDLQNRNLPLDKYFPEWAKQDKADKARERISAGAFSEVENSIESAHKKAKDAADKLRAIDTKDMSEQKKAEHEKRLAFFAGKQAILSDVLAMLRKNKGGRYFQYLGEKA